MKQLLIYVRTPECEQYMSMLRYGQYGQVGADGVWRNKEKDIKKTDDKKPTIKTDDKKITKSDKQQKVILKYMKTDKEYRLQDFCELLGLKETRTKEILKPLILDGKLLVIGKNKDRRYKLGAG